MAEAVSNWPLLFILVAAQGAFLSFLFFLKKKKVINHLSIGLLLFSLMLTYYVAYWTGYHRQLHPAFGLITLTTFLIAPFFYHFASRKQRMDIRHYIPFALAILIYGSFSFIPIQWRSTIGTIFTVAQILHLGWYTYLILTNHKSDQLSRFVGWSFLGYSITFLAYYILIWTNLLIVEYDYMISFAAAVLIYGIGYYAFMKPQLLATAKYEKSALTQSATQSIYKELSALMENEKIYLENDLKLSMMAERLGYSTNQVSQVINEMTGGNFSEYINKYRIEEAKQLILSSDTKPKFIHIATDVGFNNKISFNSAFKKFTDTSPSDYYKNKRQKLSA